LTNANPRRIAFDILHRIARENAYADQLIDHELTHGNLHGPDRGLLTELVYGVTRWQGRLDHVLAQFSDRPLARLERQVLLLLRLGLYQLLFLDRVPASAAVNETVKLTKILVPRASGFVNALLRRADRERENIRYPDPLKNGAAYLAARYSAPGWLTSQWIEQLGGEDAERLASAMAEPPPITIRTNTLRTSRSELLDTMKGEGVDAEPTSTAPEGIILRSFPHPLTRLPSFAAGLWTVQDEAAQLVSRILAPLPGERVLDLCAAPGGKTTHMAQLMGDTGSILACDVNHRKLQQIETTAKRLGIGSIETLLLNPAVMAKQLGARFFQRIMVDAPCSGLGVIRRNPEGKWRRSQDEIPKLAEQQKRLLSLAADRLEQGGRIVYATCSTTLVENERVINDFLSQRDDFVLERVEDISPELADFATPEGLFRSWPHRHVMDGFCAARLRKKV
jgi:16S rRNA (cytosine967-C5)-methyltransferase